jgi:hypothetical protein
MRKQTTTSKKSLALASETLRTLSPVTVRVLARGELADANGGGTTTTGNTTGTSTEAKVASSVCNG